eukprot:11194930-Lingulodinium_polyedra.AAC.1
MCSETHSVAAAQRMSQFAQSMRNHRRVTNAWSAQIATRAAPRQIYAFLNACPNNARANAAQTC